MRSLCRHFGTCGGCQWQDVPYREQLERKRAHVRKLIHATLGPSAPAVRPMIGVPVGTDGMPWAFRQKAAFAFGPGPGRRAGLVMGHFARGSKTVVPVDECPVHGERANRLAFALRDELARAGVPAAGPDLGGILRYVVVRTSSDEREAVVLLVVTRNDRALRAPIRAFLTRADPPSGFLVNVHDRPDPFMVGRQTIHVDGRGQVREEVGGTSFLVSPSAFFQTNVAAAAALVREVLREAAPAAGAAPGGRLLDLYAGSGLFALPLARAGYRVTAVEENAQAIRDGHLNQRLNDVAASRLRLLRARVEDALPRLSSTPFDVVVLDPPRQGCPPAVVRRLFRDVAPPRAVYVSCHPETLAQELPDICAAGYTVTRVQPVDMFPHTTHVETVVTIQRVREGPERSLGGVEVRRRVRD